MPPRYPSRQWRGSRRRSAKSTSIAGSIATAVEQQGAATAEITRSVSETGSAAKEMTQHIVEVSAGLQQTGKHAADVSRGAAWLNNAVGELRQTVIAVVRGATAGMGAPARGRRGERAPKTPAHG